VAEVAGELRGWRRESPGYDQDDPCTLPSCLPYPTLSYPILPYLSHIIIAAITVISPRATNPLRASQEIRHTAIRFYHIFNSIMASFARSSSSTISRTLVQSIRAQREFSNCTITDKLILNNLLRMSSYFLRLSLEIGSELTQGSSRGKSQARLPGLLPASTRTDPLTNNTLCLPPRLQEFLVVPLDTFRPHSSYPAGG
jgi:hypothetical protein